MSSEFMCLFITVLSKVQAYLSHGPHMLPIFCHLLSFFSHLGFYISFQANKISFQSKQMRNTFPPLFIADTQCSTVDGHFLTN